MGWDNVWPIVVIMLGAAALLLGVEIVYRALRFGTRRVSRRGEKNYQRNTTRDRYLRLLTQAPDTLVERIYRPTQLIAGTGGASLAAGWADNDDLAALTDGLLNGLYIALIWLGLVVILWLAATVGGLTLAGSEPARRFRSQTDTLTRVLSVVAVVAVVVVVLVTLEHTRAFGTTVLAGTGLIAAVTGLAAQKTLGNLFAGVAIGFNDKVNIGDVIEIDGNSGEVVDRTLTYVVVKLSGQRLLVIPSSQFLDKAHTSWKVTRHEVVGWVPLTVDWGVDIAGLTAVLNQAHRDYHANRATFNPMAYRNTAAGGGSASSTSGAHGLRVEVIGVTDSAVQVRAMVRATPDDLWDTQCAMRQVLVAWLDARAARPRLQADVTMAGQGSATVPPQRSASSSGGTSSGGTQPGASSPGGASSHGARFGGTMSGGSSSSDASSSSLSAVDTDLFDQDHSDDDTDAEGKGKDKI